VKAFPDTGRQRKRRKRRTSPRKQVRKRKEGETSVSSPAISRKLVRGGKSNWRGGGLFLCLGGFGGKERTIVGRLTSVGGKNLCREEGPLHERVNQRETGSFLAQTPEERGRKKKLLSNVEKTVLPSGEWGGGAQ